MDCPECGVEVDPASIYCHKCGARLDQTKPVAPSGPGSDAVQPSSPPPSSPREQISHSMEHRRDRGAGLGEETAMWSGGFSGKAMLGTWILTGIFSLAAVVLGFLYGGPLGPWIGVALALVALAAAGTVLLYRKWGMHYELTSQRFIHREGILRRVTDRIEVVDMEDVTFEQGIVQRMLGVGSIKIVSRDHSHPLLILRGIDDVQRVAGLIDDVRRVERRRRGIMIESL